MDYTPQPGSLPDRVCAFFRQHRDEELSTRDIAQKFDVPSASVSNTLTTCLAHGWLLRAKDDGGTTVYRAGPKLPTGSADAQSTPPASGFKNWLSRKGQASAEGRPARITLPAPDSLKIEPGVPIPEQARGALFGYYATFQKMEPGDSFACPAPAAKRLVTSARVWGKTTGRKFVTRQIDAETARIWRTE